jgi:hypothetical protein
MTLLEIILAKGHIDGNFNCETMLIHTVVGSVSLYVWVIVVLSNRPITIK